MCYTKHDITCKSNSPVLVKTCAAKKDGKLGSETIKIACLNLLKPGVETKSS